MQKCNALRTVLRVCNAGTTAGDRRLTCALQYQVMVSARVQLISINFLNVTYPITQLLGGLLYEFPCIYFGYISTDKCIATYYCVRRVRFGKCYSGIYCTYIYMNTHADCSTSAVTNRSHILLRPCRCLF